MHEATKIDQAVSDTDEVRAQRFRDSKIAELENRVLLLDQELQEVKATRCCPEPTRVIFSRTASPLKSAQ